MMRTAELSGLKQLDLPDMRVINTGIYRPHLGYEVIRVTNETERHQHVVRLLKEIDGVGIIYASTVKAVERITDYLKSAGFNVARYHGKLSASERKENQDRFMAGELKAMVATNAFGLGIDKPDIRFVIHYNMPGSLEAYYHESGRAGRDNQPARCILLYHLEDRRIHTYFIGGRYPKFDQFAAVYDTLRELQADLFAADLAQIEGNAGDAPKTKMRAILSMMKEMRLVEDSRGAHFKLLKSDLGHEELEQMASQYQEKSESDRAKLEQMMLYGQSALCRWRLLLDYFGVGIKKFKIDAIA